MKFINMDCVTFSYKGLRTFKRLLIQQLNLTALGVGALDIDIINNKVQVFASKLDDDIVL